MPLDSILISGDCGLLTKITHPAFPRHQRQSIALRNSEPSLGAPHETRLSKIYVNGGPFHNKSFFAEHTFKWAYLRHRKRK